MACCCNVCVDVLQLIELKLFSLELIFGNVCYELGISSYITSC